MARQLRVIVATSDRVELLQRTLDSLAACDRPAIYLETIVVENGPSAGVESVVRSCPATLRARYVHVSEACKSRALNVGLRECPDDCLVLFTDDDIRFSPGVLRAYARAADGVDAGCVFGGPFGIDYEQQPAPWVMEYLPPSARGWEPEPSEIDEREVTFYGCNWGAFAGDLRRVGAFDPLFGPGISGSVGEEWEIQKRLHEQRVRVRYLPDAKVWHFVPAQRCTPEWAEHRAFRNGVKWGLKQRKRDAQTLLKITRNAVRWSAWAVRLATSRVARSRRNRFRARWHFNEICGWFKGVWIAQTHEEAQDG